MKKFSGNIMLLIAALLWGTTFVAQSEGMKYIEPFTYNAARMFIGGIVLIPVVFVFSRISAREGIDREKRRAQIKTTVKGGILCGMILFIASSLQQMGIQTTTAGKSGFITALYIVIVPVYELVLFRKKTSKLLWFFAAVAVLGFYLLCIKDGFTVSAGDLLTLGCAFFFAGHIVTIDRFQRRGIDGVLMSCIQFFVSGILASLCMIFTEHPDMTKIWDAKYTILYAGLLSSGVAYTLQILGQKRTNPTIATLIMSLESVFAAVSGWLVLGEAFSLREKIGCVLVFAAVILAQLKTPESKS